MEKNEASISPKKILAHNLSINYPGWRAFYIPE